MLDVMYDIPSKHDIKKFTITKEMVEAQDEKEEEVNIAGHDAELIQLPKNKSKESA
jgi:ATP-dependent protease Clp ATPase subunit